MTPTTGILDDFNRGNGAGLGANWTALFNRIDLISNEAGGSNNSSNLSFYNPTTYGPDSEVYATISTLPANGNAIGLYLRLKDTGSLLTVDGYVLGYRRQAGVDTIQISRIDNIGEVVLGAVVNLEINVGDKLLLRAVGDQLTAEHWNGSSWSVIATRTDATYGATGYLGLSIENTLARIDDFGGGNYVAPVGEQEEGAGQADGSTSITGLASTQHNSIGVINSNTSITGLASVDHDAAAQSDGQTVITGLAAVILPSSGTIAGSTSISGAGEVEGFAVGAGDVSGSTSVSGLAGVIHNASGIVTNSTSITGTAQVLSDGVPEVQEIDDPEMNLLLNIQDFSRIACLDGRVYGVISKCDTCGLTLNDCVRSHLVTALQYNQAVVERILGFNLTTQYHEETVEWNGVGRIQTRWPGVEAINVRQVIVTIPDFGPFPISPYVQENLTLSDSGNGYCVAELSREFVDNPNHIIIRDDSGRIYEVDNHVDNYPNRDADNWYVALAGGTPTVPACAATLHAQSCKYMYVDVPDYECENDGILTPVYPNTTTPIPQIKPSEVLTGGDRRFWFSPWVLVDPAFYGEEVNLEIGEFYKLLPEIEFRCVQEVEALPVITAMNFKPCGDEFDEIVTIETTDAQWDLLHQEYGVTQMQLKSDAFGCGEANAPYKVKIYYKTNPEAFHVDRYVELLKEAIAYLTAAELPMEVCGCSIETGFIATAQKAYTEVRVNPVTGENIINLKHGNLYGQLVFAEKLALIPRYQRVIIL